MPNQPIVTAGLVLRETVTRETDKILTVLTRDGGKTPLMERAPGRKNAGRPAPGRLLAFRGRPTTERGRGSWLAEAESLDPVL